MQVVINKGSFNSANLRLFLIARYQVLGINQSPGMTRGKRGQADASALKPMVVERSRNQFQTNRWIAAH
jgi:hypothetical protein